jgi:hypothetical protein
MGILNVTNNHMVDSVLAINKNQIIAGLECPLQGKVNCVFNSMELGNAYFEKGEGRNAISCYLLAAAKGHHPAMKAIQKLKTYIDENEQAAIKQLFNRGVADRIAFYFHQVEVGDVGAIKMKNNLEYLLNISDNMSDDNRFRYLSEKMQGNVDNELFQIDRILRTDNGFNLYLFNRDYWDSITEYLDPETTLNIGTEPILRYYEERKYSGKAENLKQVVNSKQFSKQLAEFEAECKTMLTGRSEDLAGHVQESWSPGDPASHTLIKPSDCRHWVSFPQYPLREYVDTAWIEAIKFLYRHRDQILSPVHKLRAFYNDPIGEGKRKIARLSAVIQNLQPIIMKKLNSRDVENDFIEFVRKRAAKQDVEAIQFLKDREQK